MYLPRDLPIPVLTQIPGKCGYTTDANGAHNTISRETPLKNPRNRPVVEIPKE